MTKPGRMPEFGSTLATRDEVRRLGLEEVRDR